MEAWPNVRGEILESRKDSCPSLDPRDGECWKWVVFELGGRLLIGQRETGGTNDLRSKCSKPIQKPLKPGLSGAAVLGGLLECAS